MWIAAWIWACGVSEPPAPAPVEAAAASVYTTGMWRDRVLTVEAGLEEALARSSSSSAAELCRAVYQGSFEPELEPLVRSHIGWTEATTLEYGFGQVEAALLADRRDEARAAAAELVRALQQRAEALDEARAVLTP